MLVVVGCTQNEVAKLNKSTPADTGSDSISKTVSVKDFCEEREDIGMGKEKYWVDKNLADFVLADELKPYFESWKRLMKEKNQMSEEYYQAHILPWNVELKDKTIGGEVYKVLTVNYHIKIGDYYFRSKSILGKDEINVKVVDGKIISPEDAYTYFKARQIDKSLDANDLHYNWVTGRISDIRIGGRLIDKLISCEEAVSKIREHSSFMNPGTLWYLVNFDTIELGGGYYRGDDCYSTRVNLITGKLKKLNGPMPCTIGL